MKNLMAIWAYDHWIDEVGWPHADEGLAQTLRQNRKNSPAKMRDELRRHRLLYALSRDGVAHAQLYAELRRAIFAPLVEDVSAQNEEIARLLSWSALK